jgi:hypothetical protein
MEKPSQGSSVMNKTTRARSIPSKQNRYLAFGLGLLAVSLYLAIAWRWTLGF